MNYVVGKVFSHHQKTLTGPFKPFTSKQAKARFYQIYGVAMSLVIVLIILAKVI